MEKMREEFEAWVIKQNVCVKYGAKLIQCRDGSYKDYRINDRWISWKASRAAQCVELPDLERSVDCGDVLYRSDVEDALYAAGIRYT